MTSNIILTSRNIVPQTNNSVLVYKFPNSVLFNNHEIAVSSLQMYYSWQNINDTTLRNNVLTYTWESATNVVTPYTITIPSGLYEIGDINFYCQYVMIQNGHYLVNASGQNVYFFEWIVNPTIYSIQLNTYQFPTALPVGWTNPAAVPFPAATFKPQVSTPANFNLIVGFATTFTSDRDLGTAYPDTNSYTSTITPQVQPNPTLLVTSSNIDNKYASPSSVIYSVTPTVAIGEQIIEKPPEFSWNKMIGGTYAELRVTLTGSDNGPCVILDPNMTIILAIRERQTPASK
jgi:hypothetical protein